MVIALGPVHSWSVNAVWHILPGPSWSADSTPAILRGAFPIHMTVGLLAFQLLARLPFSVLVEEAFASGFLYPRLGPWAFLNIGLVGCAYHLFQWWTIPYLLPYGIALGLLRRRFGNPWPNIAWHYTANAVYFATLLR